jgi:hypothetical protein
MVRFSRRVSTKRKIHTHTWKGSIQILLRTLTKSLLKLAFDGSVGPQLLHRLLTNTTYAAGTAPILCREIARREVHMLNLSAHLSQQ